jgi:AcrR family transcriptional regulator
MPQPEEFFEEEEILEDEETINEEEVDEDEFGDEDDDVDFDDESEEEDLSEEEDDDLSDDEDEEELEEEYEVAIDAVAYSHDAEGGKIKPFAPADDKSGTNKATIASKAPFRGKAKIPDKTDFTMSEHMTAMFDGEELSEDFKNKAIAVFEAAINERYDAIVSRLEEAYTQTIEENTEKILDELASRVNDYISYIAEEWMRENRLVAESGIKTEIAENFLMGIKNVFEQNYVQIPEEKVDLVSEMEEENEELKNEINERVAETMELRKEILALRCDDIFESHCDGLADTQVEKLRTLAEGIEFDSEELFEEKLSVLKESYFGNARRVRKPAPVTQNIMEEVVLDTGDEEQELAEEAAPVNQIMQHYTSALSKKGLKNR